jgi:predicted PhzF superfamily epimerase YddE/YHI9
VDAFAAEPFKGNPAAVCLLEDAAKAADDRWLQAVAAEFNLSETAYLLRGSSDGAAPRFQLRWFTPAAEVPVHLRTRYSAQLLSLESSHECSPAPPFQVELCGHATLAFAHFLFTSVLAEHDAVVEFVTKSGILTAKKVTAPEAQASLVKGSCSSSWTSP